MGFLQKDKLSRKDKLEAALGGETDYESMDFSKPKLVVHNEPGGGVHLHYIEAEEGATNNAHLDGILKRLEEKRALEETEGSVDS